MSPPHIYIYICIYANKNQNRYGGQSGWAAKLARPKQGINMPRRITFSTWATTLRRYNFYCFLCKAWRHTYHIACLTSILRQDKQEKFIGIYIYTCIYICTYMYIYEYIYICVWSTPLIKHHSHDRTGFGYWLDHDAAMSGWDRGQPFQPILYRGRPASPPAGEER